MKLRTLTIIAILAITPWAVNFYKFVNCDFESPYKCELVHGVSIILAPLSYITVWFDTDK